MVSALGANMNEIINIAEVIITLLFEAMVIYKIKVIINREQEDELNKKYNRQIPHVYYLHYTTNTNCSKCHACLHDAIEEIWYLDKVQYLRILYQCRVCKHTMMRVIT